MNTGSTSVVTSEQGIPPSLNFSLNNPDTDTMDEADIRLPTFNRNGIEDLEQNWFLCEVVWTVFQVQSENIRKAQMITALQGRALD